MSARSAAPHGLPLPTRSEPIFNVPRVVTATIAVLALVHAVRVLLLSTDADHELLLRFGFVPLRYESSPIGNAVVPGGWPAEIWSFVTYAFIHGDVTHFALNTIWLLVFGTPVARRFGPLRFLLFFAATAAAGAAAYLVAHAGEFLPMVGASASISGCMAAALRFAFQPGAPLGADMLGSFRQYDEASYRLPALPLLQALRDIRVLTLLALWFGLNALSAFGMEPLQVERAVAWEAHLGGFLAGLLAFRLFDPVGTPANVGGATST
jgi:membrane associated rhomboid family serine protease